MPTDFDSMLAYLNEHPSILYSGTEPSGEHIEEERTFLEYARGGLWFARPNGEKHFVPIACGMTNAATGMRYLPDGFDMTKFGVTNRFKYAPCDGDKCPECGFKTDESGWCNTCDEQTN